MAILTQATDKNRYKREERYFIHTHRQGHRFYKQ